MKLNNMASSPIYQLRLSPALEAAMLSHLRETGGDVSSFVRVAIAKALAAEGASVMINGFGDAAAIEMTAESRAARRRTRRAHRRRLWGCGSGRGG